MNRLRTEIFLIPATIICLAMLGRRVTLTFGFEDLIGCHGNILSQKYLVVLGICVVAALLAIKYLRNNN